MDADGAVAAGLAAAGLGDGILAIDELAGGDNSTAWRVSFRAGPPVVVKVFGKHGNAPFAAGAYHDLFEVEAEGLAALQRIGGFPTPQVLACTPDALVLETMTTAPPEDPVFWENAGRALARLHSVTGPRFGWQHDGWLGSLRQHNDWSEDGYEFYASHRILRYLREPAVDAAFDAHDRAGLHRLCNRLPQLVPPSPPSLTHGDLAPSNILATHGGQPALIDPAASWTWAEVDLSMIYWLDRTWNIHIPPRFFEAYTEERPIDPGWRSRAPLVHLRELLSLVAHQDHRLDYVAEVRAIIRTYR